MAKICDRTPCDGLLASLGSYIFYSLKTGRFLASVSVNKEEKEVVLEYCPFCGTRLDEVPATTVNRFIKQRLKKRNT